MTGETPIETRPTVAQAIVILLSRLVRGLGRIRFRSRLRIVLFWNFVMLVVVSALPHDWKMHGAIVAGFLMIVHLGVFNAKA